MSELKPCPFCGHKANKSDTWFPKKTPFDNPQRAYYTIKCCKCRAEMKGKNWTNLVKAWNRRANDGTD